MKYILIADCRDDDDWACYVKGKPFEINTLEKQGFKPLFTRSGHCLKGLTIQECFDTLTKTPTIMDPKDKKKDRYCTIHNYGISVYLKIGE